MNNNSLPIQQWVDTIPAARSTKSSTTSVECAPNNSRVKGKFITRDLSFQSDDSHCSSVESVLELRKPDPEAILLGLGFGPKKDTNNVSRIPNRFLQPSKLLTNISLEKFLEQYGEYSSDPHSLPSSPARRRPKSC